MADSENFWDKLMADDLHAAEYMRTYGEGPGFETRHTVGSFINDGESVLDVGCGPGWNYDHFKEHGPKISKYLGLDYSRRFIRVANDRHPGKYSVGDCRSINELNRSWDVVILQDCLEHTNGYEKPVHEALRVAKRRVIISFWHLTEDDDHINDDGDDGYGAWYSRPKWEAYLNKIGHPWSHHKISPKDKSHAWDFYVIDKEVQYV